MVWRYATVSLPIRVPSSRFSVPTGCRLISAHFFLIWITRTRLGTPFVISVIRSSSYVRLRESRRLTQLFFVHIPMFNNHCTASCNLYVAFVALVNLRHIKQMRRVSRTSHESAVVECGNFWFGNNSRLALCERNQSHSSNSDKDQLVFHSYSSKKYGTDIFLGPALLNCTPVTPQRQSMPQAPYEALRPFPSETSARRDVP